MKFHNDKKIKHENIKSRKHEMFRIFLYFHYFVIS